MKLISFGRGKWQEADFLRAYSFRFTETPVFTQGEDWIGSQINPAHREGFDNISLLTRETYGAGAKITIHCAFEGQGCPEIILVETPEKCEDGAVRYGACFEMVLYRDGLNIWRHYRQEEKCSWHKRLGVSFPVEEIKMHEMTAEIRENYLDVTVDGQKMTLRVDDLPPHFHAGITVCEGIARVYDMALSQAE